MKSPRAKTYAAIAIALIAASAPAQQAFDRLVTTSPASEYHPVTSPDGRWLLFTSDRDGAPALFYRDLTTKGVAEEKRLAPHPAKSDEASFSPDGQSVVFTSFRDDALGDIYVMKFPDGTPRSISTRGRVDSNPRFTPDGKAILFQSATVGGKKEWQQFDRDSDKVSPADEAQIAVPQTPFPARAFDSRVGAALLFADDTNSDGNLGEGDDPSAWVRSGDRWQQASFPLRDASDIALNPKTGDLLVAARWFDNRDIAILAQTPLQMGMNADALMQAGNASLEADTPSFDEAIAYFRAARETPDATPEQKTAASIALMRSQNRAGRAAQVSVEGEKLLTQTLSEVDSARVKLQYYIARSILDERRSRDRRGDMSPSEDLEGSLREVLAYFDSNNLAGEAAEAHYQIAVVLSRTSSVQSALAETEKVAAYDPKIVPEDVLSGTILLRSQLFDKLGLGAETEKALTSVFALNPKDKTILERAADRIIDITYARARNRDEKILALRDLAAKNEPYPYLVARVKLAEAKLLEEIDSFEESERAYRVAIEQGERALTPAVRAALELASMQTRRGRFADAVATTRNIENWLAKTEIPGARESYLAIRTRLIRSYLEKGRSELELGDARLASATFDELLAFDPRLTAGWRGKLRAVSGEPGIIQRLVTQFESEAKSKPQDALAQYKLGLALSYPDPASERARKAIDRAIASNGADPYFHLTRGFIYEQQYTKFRERGDQRNELLEQASLSYEQALMLARTDEDPGFVADAILNSANVALSLNQYYKAHTLYQRRESSTYGFDDGRTELLFHWNAGVAAFRSSNSKDAAREFQLALKSMDKVETQKLIPEERVASIRRELTGRRALAFMEAGDNDAAQRAFRDVYAMSDENSMDRVRALRNRAVILERIAANQISTQRYETLADAETTVRQALDELSAPGLKPGMADATRGGGLIDIKFVFNSSPVGGAKLGFDKRDEARLLYATLGRILELQGKREQAIAELNRQIEHDPSLNDQNRAYYLSARSVTLSRIADQWRAMGNNAEATQSALGGLAISYYKIKDQVFVNTNSATLFLVQLAELTAREPNLAALKNPKSFWMLSPSELRAAGNEWELLDRAAAALGTYPDPAVRGVITPVVSDPAERARLALVRAMANEHLAWQQPATSEDPGNDALATLRAEMKAAKFSLAAEDYANSVRDLGAEANTTQEVYRLGVLASGIQSRVAFATRGDAEGAKVLDVAIENARATGYGHLVWWLQAQGAAAAQADAEQARWAEAAKQSLLHLVVYTDQQNETYPDDLLNALESAQLSRALAANDLNALWTITDEWRTIRLRWTAADASPIARTPAEGAWLASHDAIVSRYRDAQNRLRNIPAVGSLLRTRTLAEVATIDGELSQSLATGRTAGWAATNVRDLQALPFSNIEILLQPPFFTKVPPVLVLDRRIPGASFRVVYTTESAQLLPPDQPLPTDSPLFLFGEGDASTDGDAVRVLSGATLLSRMSGLTLRTNKQAYAFPPARLSPDDTRWITDVQLASTLDVTVPFEVRSTVPTLWNVQGTGVSLGELLRTGTDLEKISFTTSGDVDPLPVALALESAGVREATINNQRWLGITIDPKQAPQRAQEELAVLATRLQDALMQNKDAESVVSLEQIIVLKEALDDRTDLQLYYGKLAEQRGRLGKWAEAVSAAQRRVAVLQKDGADGNLLAQGEKMLADSASQARSWDVSFPAYDLSIAGFQKAGDTAAQAIAMESKAISLEIAGRFDESIETSRAARALFTKPEDQLLQDLRIARIQRVYLNRYGDAETLLRSIAETAEKNNLPKTVAEAKINLARTLQSVASFDESMAVIDEVDTLAEQLDSDTYRAQVKLERANVHWLRSEYFEAFRLEQEVLEIATRTKDIPVEISVRNVAGLTAWSVNDLKRGYAELSQAMELSEKAQDDAKIATTANNTGLLSRSEKKYDDALGWFRRAMEIDTRQGNRWGQAYDLRNTGITLHLAGKSADAVEPLMRAVDLSAEIGDQVNNTKAQLALADAQLTLQNTQVAESGYNAALEKARAIPLPEVQWRALYGLGRIALQRGDDSGAVTLYSQAADIVDSLRASIRIEELQDGFLLDKQGLYDEIIELKLKLNDVAGALETSERARGRNFIDLLGNHKINLGNVADQKLLEREKLLRADIESLERQVNGAAAADRTVIAEKLARARQQYSDFMVHLRTQSPEVSSFVRVDAISVPELQKLIEPDTRMVVYHLLPGGPVCWVVGNDTLNVVRLPATSDEIATRVQAARLKLQNFEPVEEDMQALANILIVPAEPYFTGAKRLCIVPHQSLHTLPFAALSYGGAQSLIDRYALYYSPSASVLRYTVARRADRAKEEKTLAIGNPNLGSTQYDLPFAQKEAERLTFDFPSVTVRTGSDATESWLVKNLPNFGIIHIASHGEYNPDAPLFSAIELSPDNQNDGHLTSGEVFNLQLRADLISLSACQSGLGRISNGDDIVGLNRAFVYAGTRQLMTTLWRVDDISTAVLFKYVYRNMRDTDRAEAVRQAQIRLKNRPEYRHPAHWAGLVLSGDWQ